MDDLKLMLLRSTIEVLGNVCDMYCRYLKLNGEKSPEHNELRMLLGDAYVKLHEEYLKLKSTKEQQNAA